MEYLEYILKAEQALSELREQMDKDGVEYNGLLYTETQYQLGSLRKELEEKLL